MSRVFYGKNMATTPTNLPVPSETPRDLKFNAGKIDELVTSLANQYVDRFGNAHYTIEGLRWLAQKAIAQYGWILIDSFQGGADITLPNQALRDEDTGEYYRWDGALPKHVDAGSTPSSSGGVGIGAWVGIGDAALRTMLSQQDGVNIVNGAVKNVPNFSSLRNGHHGLCEVIMTVEHHAGGLGGASYRRSGTTGTPSSGNEALVYDADGIGWKMVKQPVQSARAFGVLGNGVDDRAAIQLGADFVGQNGGGVLYVESLNGFNDVELGDSLTITFSGVEIKLGDGVHVHTE